MSDSGCSSVEAFEFVLDQLDADAGEHHCGGVADLLGLSEGFLGLGEVGTVRALQRNQLGCVNGSVGIVLGCQAKCFGDRFKEIDNFADMNFFSEPGGCADGFSSRRRTRELSRSRSEQRFETAFCSAFLRL